MKRCTTCGEAKSPDAFYARKAGKDGRNSQCRDCVRAYSKRWRQENPDRVAAFREQSKPAQRKAHRAYRERNPEKIRAWDLARRERVLADPERQAKKSEADKRWRRENPEKFRAQRTVQNHRRREARVAMRSDEDVRAYVLVLYRDPCSYCGAPAEEIDHIVAHAQGGETVWDNLTAACLPCNRRKRDRSLLDFLLR